jgi:hypothetical protein
MPTALENIRVSLDEVSCQRETTQIILVYKHDILVTNPVISDDFDKRNIFMVICDQDIP